MGPKRERHANWVFTLNNWEDHEYTALQRCDFAYIVIGKEVGKEGTPHLQGYVEFMRAMDFGPVKNICPRAHWEPAKSTDKAAEYCKKDGNFWEGGIRKNQGKRNDLLEIKTKIDDGEDLASIANEYFAQVIRYHKGFTEYKNMKLTARTEKPRVIWLYGKAGTGKTSTAVNSNPDFYIKDGTQWWNGYTQQHTIIIDDFDGHWPFRDLLRLLDRYPYQGQTKGGYIQINSPCIYITCEFHPEHFWSLNTLDQVLRRLDEITEVSVTQVTSQK